LKGLYATEELLNRNAEKTTIFFHFFKVNNAAFFSQDNSSYFNGFCVLYFVDLSELLE